MLLSTFFFIISTLTVLYNVNKSYSKGFIYAIFFLTLFSKNIYFAYEIISVHRMIIIILLANYIVNKNYFKPVKTSSLKILYLISFFKLLSLMNSIDINYSMQKTAIFLIERLLFLYLSLHYIDNNNDIDDIFNSIFYALAISAIIGFFQKYTGLLISEYLAPTSEGLTGNFRTYSVYSTFQHPILFGIGMSIGWCIGLYKLKRTDDPLKKFFIWFFIFLMFGNLYFSFSRGPWLASLFAMFIYLLFEKYSLKRILPIVVAVFLVFIIREGVWESLSSLIIKTFIPTEIEGSSFNYRFLLLSQVLMFTSSSIPGLILGFGEGATRLLSIGQAVTTTGYVTSFQSWDMEYAIIIFQNGFIGLFLFLLLISYNCKEIFLKLRISEEKNLLILLLQIILIMAFMMTNVSIFSQQLWFIFFATIAMIEKLKLEDKENCNILTNKI